MKVWVLPVGRPTRLFADAVAEFERRAGRYWTLETVEVRAARASRSQDETEVRAEEADRLLARAPDGAEIVALTRSGDAWDSTELARYLERLAVQGSPGAAFLIGGAFGLDPRLLARAHHRLALSSFTLPHDLARLVLAEQIYRAGTIVRHEPYHKG